MKHVSTIFSGIVFSSVLLKVPAEEVHLQKNHWCYSLSHSCFFFNFTFLNFGLTRTCSLFLQWKLQLLNFSTWNKKSDSIIFSSYFTLTHNGNQHLLIRSPYCNEDINTTLFLVSFLINLGINFSPYFGTIL